MVDGGVVTVTILPDGRMNRANAARYLGLSTKTLAMYAVRGVGPKFIKRGRVFYFRDDLDRWMKGGQAGGSPNVPILEDKVA
ncbi:MAG: helix-turn-helix domain-containing protein [Candidatus Sulfotelmatobacter sp.]